MLATLLSPLRSVAQESDDFVRASLLVATPGAEIYNSLGHACLRLQCPDYDLDYIYSYEGEDIAHMVLRFFAGQLLMAVRAVPTSEYLSHYAAEGRGVSEYRLNLPLEVRRRLWQQMDERLEQPPVRYDYMNRGCAVSVLKWIEEAVGRDNICYGDWGEIALQSRKDIGGNAVKDAWHLFWTATIVAGESYDVGVEPTDKIVLPPLLVSTLQTATVDGQPLLSQDGVELLPTVYKVHNGLFTPLVISILLLLLATVNLNKHWTVVRIAELAVCMALGLFVWYLVFCSRLTCTEWNWLVIPFCPFLLLLWPWRRMWTVPMAAVCFVWAVAMVLAPHKIVDKGHMVLAAALGLVYIEIYISTKMNSKKKNK